MRQNKGGIYETISFIHFWRMPVAWFPPAPACKSSGGGTSIVKTGLASPEGYDLVIDNSKVLLKTLSSMKSNDPNWILKPYSDSTIPERTGLCLCYNGTNPAAEKKYTYNGADDYITLSWNSVVSDSSGGTYDMEITLSNIWRVSNAPIENHSIMEDWTGSAVGIWVSSHCFKNGNYDTSSFVSTRLDITYRIFYHGTKQEVPDKILFGFTDLDVSGRNGYSGSMADYQESIKVLSEPDTIYVEPNTCLYIKVSEREFLSTRQTSDLDTLNSGLSFIGTSGTSVRWAGTWCASRLFLDAKNVIPSYTVTPSSEGPGTITPGTPVTAYKGQNKTFLIKASEHAHIKSLSIDGKAVSLSDTVSMDYTFEGIKADHQINAVFEPDSYSVSTTVRHQQADGNWSAPETVDTKTVVHGKPYTYTWVRGSEEPVSVYGEPVSKTVGTDSVTKETSYQIDIPRKQYTYSFDLSLSAGHTVSEVTGRQNAVTKYAENLSGAVSSPSLKGYAFSGWKDKDGNVYKSEAMLSNKTFYASWTAGNFQVKYEGNPTHPGSLPGEKTQDKITSASGMPLSSYTFDVSGTLRANDFVRKGYKFLGWGRTPSGAETLLPDRFSGVLNWTDTSGGIVPIYARWEQLLGTETLTVVSEETGNPVADVSFALYRKNSTSWEQVTDVSEQVTDRNGQIRVSNLHWFDYEWRPVSVPKGYKLPAVARFSISAEQLSHSSELVLFMQKRSLTVETSVSSIRPGERPPAFLYHVSGTDAAGVKHSYDVLVQTDENGKGTSSVSNLYAGDYVVTQTPVSWYKPETPVNISHTDISGTGGTARLLSNESAAIRFPYRLSAYSGFGSVDSENNRIP